MSGSIPDADDGGATVGFSMRDARRVGEAVRWIEGRYRNPPPARGRYPTGAGFGLVPVVLGAALAAGSLAAPTHATCTVLQQGTGAALTATGGTTEELYNASTTAIGSGKLCWATRRNGFLYFVVGDC